MEKFLHYSLIPLKILTIIFWVYGFVSKADIFYTFGNITFTIVCVFFILIIFLDEIIKKH